MSEALEKAAEAVGDAMSVIDMVRCKDHETHIARAAITAFLSEVGLEGIRAAILSEPTINADLQAQEVYKALMAHVADNDVQDGER